MTDTSNLQRHIKVLDDITANAIAAGEVIERPASVAKELIENSLDAGATQIEVSITQGGIGEMRITDNGVGFLPGDVPLAFVRHATSKMETIADLDNLSTMGFRGEALASIAAVSKLTLVTQNISAEMGMHYEVIAGDISASREVATNVGTTISVSNLFFNTPARYKFLRKEYVEANAIVDAVAKIALAHPDVAFVVFKDGSECLRTPGNGSFRDVIYAVWGKEYTNMIELKHNLGGIQIKGFMGNPNNVRKNRSKQLTYVNGRLIRAKMLQTAIEEGGKTWFMRGCYPPALVFIEMPPDTFDVNVSPQKTDIRFVDDKAVFRSIYHAVRNALTHYANQLSEIDGTNSPVAVQIPMAIQSELVDHKQNITTKQQLQNVLPEYSVPETTQWHHALTFEQQLNTYDGTKLDAEVASEDFKAPSQDCMATTNDEVQTPAQTNAINQLGNAKYIGQIFDTYIVLEQEQQVLLIDQHAAHERILYEKMKKARLAKPTAGLPPQLLLAPLALEVSASDIEVITEHANTVRQAGFEVELFSQNTVIIRGVPWSSKEHMDNKKALLELVDLISRHTESDDPLELDELDHHLACKAAIKAHHKLDPLEVRAMIKALGELENPYHCPHGRPTIIRMDKYEIEKRFKRIV